MNQKQIWFSWMKSHAHGKKEIQVLQKYYTNQVCQIIIRCWKCFNKIWRANYIFFIRISSDYSQLKQVRCVNLHEKSLTCLWTGNLVSVLDENGIQSSDNTKGSNDKILDMFYSYMIVLSFITEFFNTTVIPDLI